MRICILTQPLGTNYGGILQAFALQKVLKDMGHNVTTLRWLPLTPRNPIKTIRRVLAKYIKGNRDIVYFNYEKQLHHTFRKLERFIDEHIDYLVANAPLKEGDFSSYDAYIVGSDQVWRPIYSPFIPNFYLDFLADSPSKRIAYAASFGVDTWETDEEMTRFIRPLAQKFSAVSVREESAINLCENYLGVKAVVMPDPTLLLTAEDYRQFFSAQKAKKEPYIAAYILDRNDKRDLFLDRIAKETGLPIQHIGQLDWINGVDSLEWWIESIADASFIVTDSFHGTVFSLLFGKEFISISNSSRGSSRFTSLLSSLGLQDRLFDPGNLDISLMDIPKINYTVVSEMMSIMRQTGLTFLKNNL